MWLRQQAVTGSLHDSSQRIPCRSINVFTVHAYFNLCSSLLYINSYEIRV